MPVIRIVVLGGFGNFGVRVCRALADDAEVEVIAAGRHPEQGFGDARLDQGVKKARLDMAAAEFAADLKALSAHSVIHCAGPFQGQDYRVAIAALAAGAHYIDLSDSRDFVANFNRNVDAQARAAVRLAVSGASSVPALSSAVVDCLAPRFHNLEEIQTVIAPAQRAARGAATIAGVFSYAGKPFQWLSHGQWQTVHGWQALRRFSLASLGKRWSAACDVPDLALFPLRYPGVATVEFRAALEVGVQHSALWMAALLRRAGIPLPIERWALPMDRFAQMLESFGSERGGMLVSLRGTNADAHRMCCEWHLLADANHGPEIPCMAAVLMARKLMEGELDAVGAHPCMGFLTLADFEPEFARWGITTQLVERDA